MSFPKISIVTPSYNQDQFLEKTILSVINQNYPNLEYIIIDGGSTDNSVEIIKKYEKNLAYWVSEKDSGQSAAINKGLKRWTGDIFNWLCSDDFLEEGSLMHIANAFLKNEECLCYSGKLRKFSASGAEYFYGNMLFSTWEETLCKRILKQPSVFYGRQAIEKMGLLNESLHYCMDAEWLYKFLFQFNRKNIVEDEFLVAHYLIHDSSKSGSASDGFIRENDSIIYSFAETIEHAGFIALLQRNSLNREYQFPKEILLKQNKFLVEKVIFSYALRRAVMIYNKNDFEFARFFLKINHEKMSLDANEKKMMIFLQKYVKGSSWIVFKMRRTYLWKVKRLHLGKDVNFNL